MKMRHNNPHHRPTTTVDSHPVSPLHAQPPSSMTTMMDPPKPLLFLFKGKRVTLSFQNCDGVQVIIDSVQEVFTFIFPPHLL